MKKQFIVDEGGKKIAVVLPMKEYEKMMEELEELDDIRLYDQAKMVRGVPVSFYEYVKSREVKL